MVVDGSGISSGCGCNLRLSCFARGLEMLAGIPALVGFSAVGNAAITMPADFPGTSGAITSCNGPCTTRERGDAVLPEGITAVVTVEAAVEAAPDAGTDAAARASVEWSGESAGEFSASAMRSVAVSSFRRVAAAATALLGTTGDVVFDSATAASLAFTRASSSGTSIRALERSSLVYTCVACCR